MLFFSDVDAKDISETYDSAYQYATEILTEYYEAIDQYKEEDFSDNISSGLLQYIIKIEAKRYKLDVYGKDDMQNYRLSFNY